MTPERIQFLRATVGSEAVADVEAEWDEMLNEIERLRVLVVSAHALNYPRGSCSCGWLPVDLRGGNANYSWGCPDDWRIEHAAHVEELLNGGAK